MLVAIPSLSPGGLDAPRSEHFGRCPCFTLVRLGEGGETDVTVLQNRPHGAGGCLEPIEFLASHGVEAVVVSGIGMRPLLGFDAKGIKVYRGVGSTVRESLEALKEGRLERFTADMSCGGRH